MRYHYEKPAIYSSYYGSTYECDHPVYNRCTLFEIGDKGLAVVQQRFGKRNKVTWWTEIDPWLTDELYLHKNFRKVFNERAGISQNGLYPTITVRQLMWALKMKPMIRQQWETCFDRKSI